MHFGPALVLTLAVAASAGVCEAQLREFPEPEWRDDQYGFALQMPPGTILCIGPEGSSASHPVSIPIEQGARCEDVGSPFANEGVVVVEAYYDAAEQYENIGQLVSETCEARAQTRLVSTATIAHAGKRLGGLATMTCELELGDGTFMKIAVARKEERRAPPIDFFVTLHATMDGRDAAVSAWSTAISSFHLIR